MPTGSYFHHRYFECNYGEAIIPLDRWFGTFRNGLESKEDKGFVGGKLKEPAWVLATTLMGGALVGVAPLIKLGLTCAAAF
ncbi:hypothetical protein N9362_00015 [bacterium]|nr:hypothetical protein [bacterium]